MPLRSPDTGFSSFNLITYIRLQRDLNSESLECKASRMTKRTPLVVCTSSLVRSKFNKISVDECTIKEDWPNVCWSNEMLPEMGSTRLVLLNKCTFFGQTHSLINLFGDMQLGQQKLQWNLDALIICITNHSSILAEVMIGNSKSIFFNQFYLFFLSFHNQLFYKSIVKSAWIHIFQTFG